MKIRVEKDNGIVIKLNTSDIINAIKQMSNEEKKELSKHICKDEVIMPGPLCRL